MPQLTNVRIACIVRFSGCSKGAWDKISSGTSRSATDSRRGSVRNWLLVEPIRPSGGEVLFPCEGPLGGRREFQIPALECRLDDQLIPDRRNQGGEEADKYAGHRNRFAV